MRAEAVVLDVAAPVGVHALGALGGRTDAVAPVIIVGEAAAGPAEHGHAKFLEVIDRGAANAVDVGHRRVLADPDAAIDARAQMFGEVRMQFGPDDTDFLVSMDHGFAVAGALAEDGTREQRGERSGGGGLNNTATREGHKRTSLS